MTPPRFSYVRNAFFLWLALNVGAATTSGQPMNDGLSPMRSQQSTRDPAKTLSAELRPSEVTLGQIARLEVYVPGGAPGALDVPSVPGLAIELNSRAQKYEQANGRVLKNGWVFEYLLQARRTGTYNIPSIEWRGQSTEPLQLTVVEPSFDIERLRQSPANPTGNRAFIDLIPERDTVFVGEPFRYTIQIAQVRGVVRDIGNFQFSPQGFTLAPIQPDGFIPRDETHRIGGNDYTIRLLSNETMARAVKAGSLEFGPASVDVEFLVNNRRNSRTFGGLLTGSYKSASIQSDPVTINVKPLPTEGRPEEFNGAIGQFTMTQTVTPKKLGVGDPLTIEIKIGGKGAMDSVRLPKTFDWPDIKTYEPIVDVSYSDAIESQGVARFEIVARPESTDVTEIPAIQFAYFDPRDATYRTLEKPPVAIEVAANSSRNAATEIPNSYSAKNSRNADERLSLTHIQPRPQFLARIPTPLVYNGLFWTIVLAPICAYGTYLGARKAQEVANRDSDAKRQREIQREIDAQLAALEEYAQTGQSTEFFEGLSVAIRQFIGLRLGVTPNALTESVVYEELGQHYEDTEAIESLGELFRLCDAAKFGSGATQHTLSERLTQFREATAALPPLN